MINLILKSDLNELKEECTNLVTLLKKGNSFKSKDVDTLIFTILEKYFLNTDDFFNNYYHSFKNSTYVGIWYQGKAETYEERKSQEESEIWQKVNFLTHLNSLIPFVNSFHGEKSKYRNRPYSFSNLAYYFLLKLSELKSDFYFPVDWILFAEGIEINTKLVDDLKKYLQEKEYIEFDLHFDCRISYKGRLFIEEKSIING